MKTYEFAFGHGDLVHGENGLVVIDGQCNGVWEDGERRKWYCLQWRSSDGVYQTEWFSETQVSLPAQR